MTFPDQTILVGQEKIDVPGNCFQACIAGILGISINAVPHFALLGIHHWLDCAVAWLSAEHEVQIDTINSPADPGYVQLKHCMLRGQTIRGTHHAVIGLAETGEMVHDPHPERAGLTFLNSTFYFYKKQ
jgi:hypothetical protein